jgi:hypothetical protein
LRAITIKLFLKAASDAAALEVLKRCTCCYGMAFVNAAAGLTTASYI